MFCLSAGPVNAIRQVPPYLPISFVGCRTSGSAGRRWSSGGRVPALTRSANIGASLNCLGVFAGSVMICGRLVDPAAAGAWVAAAAAVVGAGAVVAAGGAVVGAGAGFWAAAGAVVGVALGGTAWPQAANKAAAPLRPRTRTKLRLLSTRLPSPARGLGRGVAHPNSEPTPDQRPL